MIKLRFVADSRVNLGLTKDYLISLKLRGHGNWYIGDAMDDPDGTVHFDVASFSEDPELTPDNIKMYTAAGVSVAEVPLDVKPSEPITTSRYVKPTIAHEMTEKVMNGSDPVIIVDNYVKAILDKAEHAHA